MKPHGCTLQETSCQPDEGMMQLSSVLSHSLPFVCPGLKKNPTLVFIVFLFKNTELVI